MPSFVVTGASRGIGLEFVRQLSSDSSNAVFAIVRNKLNIAHGDALHRPNVLLLEADITDHATLRSIAAQVSSLARGAIDVLINNGGLFRHPSNFMPLGKYPAGEEDLLVDDLRKFFDVNVIGVIQTINAFLPLLRAGRTKKVIVISGPGDVGTVLSTEDSLYPSYAISKAGVNMAVAKYAVEHRYEGFVFVAVDPGVIKNTSGTSSGAIGSHYQAYVAEMKNAHPEVEEAITVEESVRDQISLIDNISAMDSGAFLTRTGRKYRRGLA